MDKKEIQKPDPSVGMENMKRRVKSAGGAIQTVVMLLQCSQTIRNFAIGQLAIFIGKEAEDIGLCIVKRFKFKHDKAINFVDYTKYVSWAVNSVIMWYLFTFGADSDFSSINWVSFVMITCFHTIALLFYIGYELNGEWKDDNDAKRNEELSEINDELCKITLLKTAIDVLNYQWTNQLVLMLAKNLVSEKAIAYCVLTCATSWWSESGGLFFGRGFGGPKFSYFISPKKTWSGFAGQFVFSGVGHLTYMLIMFLVPKVNGDWYHFSGWTSFFAYYFFASIASTFGDLFESLYKRTANVKDSSIGIKWTHGGLMDKWDSLSFVFCVTNIFAANGWIY